MLGKGSVIRPREASQREVIGLAGFRDEVAAFMRRRSLVRAGDRVLIGLSGGADSTALLAVLVELREEFAIDLRAAHLNHGLRGRAADDDARFVEDLCRRFGVPFVMTQVDVAALAARRGWSLEVAGRFARYRFFDEVAAAEGCRRIAVGHHRDDQIETILMRFLQGAGSDGLSGMRPQRGRVIRPLLEQPRAAILAYLRERGLRYRVDASNVSPRFVRNRIRHRLLPLLRSDYNPQLDDALWRMATLLADEADYLDEQAEQVLAAALRPWPGGVWLERAPLLAAPSALRRRALRLAWWRLQPPPAPPLAAAHVLAMEEVARSGGAVDLPGGSLRCEQDFLYMYMDAGASLRDGDGKSAGDADPPHRPPHPPHPPRILPVPGAVSLWPGWPSLSSQLVDLLPSPASRARDRASDCRDPAAAHLDYDALGRPARLVVRTWRPGDRIQPLNAPGRRKLQDLFVDRKIPRSLRAHWPIVCLRDEPVWVVGLAVADRYRLRPDSRRAVSLTLARRDRAPLLQLVRQP